MGARAFTGTGSPKQLRKNEKKKTDEEQQIIISKMADTV